MVVKIVGIETQDFTFDDGKTYKGKKLHVVNVDEHKENLVGSPVSVIKIPATNEYYTVPIDVDKLYTVFYDQKGKVAFLQAVNK